MSKIQGCLIQSDWCWMGNVVLFIPKNEMFIFLINPHSRWEVFRSFNIVHIEKVCRIYKGKLNYQHENLHFLLRMELKHLWQQLRQMCQACATGLSDLDLRIFCFSANPVKFCQVKSAQSFSRPIRVVQSGLIKDSGSVTQGLWFVPQPLLCRLGQCARSLFRRKVNFWPSLRSWAFLMGF